MIKVRTWLNRAGVLGAVRQATIERYYKCGLLVEADAKQSMKEGGKVEMKSGKMKGVPSTPPDPPHVQTGNLRTSIQTAKTGEGTVVVGPTNQAWYGKIHEFGGRFHPKRPFMRPALARMANKFPKLFENLPLGGTVDGKKLNTKEGEKDA